MPAGCQPKDKLAARALQSARAAFTVAATLIAGCASIDSSGDSALLRPVELTFPGDEPTAVSSAVSPRAQALADQAAQDVAQLESLSAEALGFAGPLGTPVAPVPVVLGVGVDWIQPGTVDALPVTTSPDRPAPVRRVQATGEPEPVMIGAFDELDGEVVTPDAVVMSVDPLAAGPPSPTSMSPETGSMPMLVDLSRSLYQQASTSDVPMRPLLVIAATTLLDPSQAVATDAIPGLTDRERELLSVLQGFFTDLGARLEADGDPEVIVEAVADLGQTLTGTPSLGIVKAALCTRVGGFGDYDEFRQNDTGGYTFLAQDSQQAVVYVELVDFSSTLSDSGQWVTELAQQIVVYSDRDGIPVQRVDWQPGVDSTRNRRDDFFLVQVITLNDRLSVGRYQLKIRVRDEASGAEAETAVEFALVADPQLASAGQ